MTKREIGIIVEAKVKKIVNDSGVVVHFGENQNGFIHISEISYKYVKNINHFLKPKQTIKAKIIEIKNNKTYLSLKRVSEKNDQTEKTPIIEKKEDKEKDKQAIFEDKLKDFFKESSEKLKQIQNSMDRKRGVKKKHNPKNK